MKVIGMIVKYHLARVTALVAVVFIMQRLVQVANEVNHEFEGLRLSPNNSRFLKTRKASYGTNTVFMRV
jgi:hypothetical protein